MVERGRWLKVPRTDRLCVYGIPKGIVDVVMIILFKLYMFNKLEDEFHVICECPRYSCIRKLYIKPYYVRKPSMFKLVALLNTDNVSEKQKLAIFIKRALMIHKDGVFN